MLSKLIKITLFFGLFVHSFAFAGSFSDARLYDDVSQWHGFAGSTFRVKLCRIKSNGAEEEIAKKKLKIHFTEDSHLVRRKYRNKIKRFIKSLPKNTNRLIVRAHADQCGSAHYNKVLSEKRFVSVYNLIKRSKFPRRVRKIEYDIKGESESSAHTHHDRYVEIIAHYPKPIRKFNKIVILDISGSIHPGNKRRTVTGASYYELKNKKFKPGTMVYVARDARRRCQGTTLSNYDAIGEDAYNEAQIILSKYLRGKAVGEVWTDYTDPKNKRTSDRLMKIKSYKKIKWWIY